MNQQFFDTLTAVLTELTAGLSYYHLPSDSARAPQIINTILLRPTGQIAEGDEYPLVRFRLVDGEFARMTAAPFTVLIDCGVRTSGSISDGLRDIAELTMAIGGIVKRPWFSPYKLRNRVRFELGDPGTDYGSKGIQPHPYYFSRLYLEFTVAKYSATEE
jgi:hypothetical protein